MSNEYKDWMNDGGACGDCVSLMWRGRKIRCTKGEDVPRDVACSKFKHVDVTKEESWKKKHY